MTIRRKVLSTLVFLYIFISLPVLSLCVKSRIESYLAKNVTKEIVHIGDSITASPGNDWPKYLNTKRHSSANLAVPGYGTWQVSYEVDGALSHNPKRAIILTGTNDARMDNYSIEVVEKYLRKIVKRFNEANVKCHLTLVPLLDSDLQNARVSEINSVIRSIARECDCALIDLPSHICDDRKILDRFSTDGVHLTNEAYVIWGKLIAKSIREN